MKDLLLLMQRSGRQAAVDFVNNIQAKVSAQEGNTLPVSAFKDYVDGTIRPVLLHTRNVVSQLISRYGIRKTVSSVTDVLMSARTLQSVRLL